MRLLALAIGFTTLTALTAHAAAPTDTWCRSSAIAKVRQHALEDSRTAGRPGHHRHTAVGQHRDSTSVIAFFSFADTHSP